MALRGTTVPAQTTVSLFTNSISFGNTVTRTESKEEHPSTPGLTSSTYVVLTAGDAEGLRTVGSLRPAGGVHV